jgi:hypothetical protein
MLQPPGLTVHTVKGVMPVGRVVPTIYAVWFSCQLQLLQKRRAGSYPVVTCSVIPCSRGLLAYETMAFVKLRRLENRHRFPADTVFLSNDSDSGGISFH